ncbi:ABC transporter ATP-binding protein [Streptomyces niveiscabiei]|uniref:ABC transporter ATP-binding protein n=1 Tax=Streptomyces niveiscabiei TaxID=164115 RepID=UPI00389B15D2
MVETGTTQELYGNPAHPYTRALLSASPPGRVTAADLGDGVHPGSPPGGIEFFKNVNRVLSQGEDPYAGARRRPSPARDKRLPLLHGSEDLPHAHEHQTSDPARIAGRSGRSVACGDVRPVRRRTGRRTRRLALPGRGLGRLRLE